MRLATQDNQTRDGALIVVNDSATFAASVTDIASTLQAALDNWSDVSQALQARSDSLGPDQAHCFPFDPTRCLAPLPRAYQWADGSAYVTHVELVRKARGAKLPETFWTDPLMYQGGSDTFLAGHAPVYVADEAYGIDYEAELGVITTDVPMGVSPEDATRYIALFVLINDVSLRGLIPNELGKGFGFFHSKPPTAFAPLAITPDELGQAFDGQRVHLPMRSYVNGELMGQPNAGVDMTFHFGQLIAHAAKTRPLGAGSIVGSGTVANKNNHEVGSSCLAEKRMQETLDQGQPETPFLRFGDRVRIEMRSDDGRDLFGQIDQEIKAYV